MDEPKNPYIASDGPLGPFKTQAAAAPYWPALRWVRHGLAFVFYATLASACLMAVNRGIRFVVPWRAMEAGNAWSVYLTLYQAGLTICHALFVYGMARCIESPRALRGRTLAWVAVVAMILVVIKPHVHLSLEGFAGRHVLWSLNTISVLCGIWFLRNLAVYLGQPRHVRRSVVVFTVVAALEILFVIVEEYLIAQRFYELFGKAGNLSGPNSVADALVYGDFASRVMVLLGSAVLIGMVVANFMIAWLIHGLRMELRRTAT